MTSTTHNNLVTHACFRKQTLHRDDGSKRFLAHARFADNGENIYAHWDFSYFALDFKPTQALPIATVSLPGHRNMIKDWFGQSRRKLMYALRTFRGTLVDGVLHPNVRLDNGLQFSFDPTDAPDYPVQGAEGEHVSPGGAFETQQAITAPRKPGRQLQTSRSKTVDGRGQNRERTQSRDVRIAKTKSKAAELDARERDLEQREEMLSLKEKVMQLEQQLAQAGERTPKEAPNRTGYGIRHVKIRKAEPAPVDPAKATTQEESIDEIHDFLTRDDTMPVDALELLRRVKGSRNNKI